MYRFISPRTWLASPRRRSLAGLILALAAVPFLLGVDACSILKTPIGDPAKGWTDPRISGVWLSSETGSGSLTEFAGQIWVFEPFDATTWLLTLAPFTKSSTAAIAPQPLASAPEAVGASAPEAMPDVPGIAHVVSTLRDERASPGQSTTYKAWLTSLGGRRFLVLQEALTPSTQRGFRPMFWLVFAVSLRDGLLILSIIDTKVEHLEDVSSRARAEAIIARHAAQPTFTKEAFVLHPVPRSSFDDAARALQRRGGR